MAWADEKSRSSGGAEGLRLTFAMISDTVLIPRPAKAFTVSNFTGATRVIAFVPLENALGDPVVEPIPHGFCGLFHGWTCKQVMDTGTDITEEDLTTGAVHVNFMTE